jgi:hypothetical protein
MLAIIDMPVQRPLGSAANNPDFVRLPSRLFNVAYRLRNGHQGTVPMISTTRRGALLRVVEMFPEQLRMASIREVLV